MRLAYTKAKNYEALSFSVVVLIAFMAIALFFTKDESFITYSAIAIFIMRIGVFALTRARGRWATFGHQVHRFNMFYTGLGEPPPADLVPDLKQAFDKQLDEPLKVNGSYFSTVANVGPVRLVEAVTESAFHTSYLAQYTAAIFLVPLISVGVLVVCGLHGVTLSLDQFLFGRIIGIIVSSIVLTEILGRYLDYLSHENKTKDIFVKGLNLLKKPSEISQEIAKDFAYSYLLSKTRSPLIPDTVYHFFGAKIDKNWKSTYVPSER
jgi:hypothetical protein